MTELLDEQKLLDAVNDVQRVLYDAHNIRDEFDLQIVIKELSKQIERDLKRKEPGEKEKTDINPGDYIA